MRNNGRKTVNLRMVQQKFNHLLPILLDEPQNQQRIQAGFSDDDLFGLRANLAVVCMGLKNPLGFQVIFPVPLPIISQ
jgi:hypothetical protein